MDIGLITFPLIAGIITNLVTALINRSGWSSKAKTYVAFGVALLLTIAGVIFQIFPQAWPTVAAGIAAVFGVSQAVYPIIKPILKQLEEATTGKTATVDDLDAAAAGFRRAHGHRLRIATKYHRLVHDFLRAAGVADYQLVDSQGATEGTVANLTAEAIADITSSGETLRANNLRILDEAPILRSQATLFASRAAMGPAMDALIARLVPPPADRSA